MYAHAATTEQCPLMSDLVLMLGDLPVGSSKPRAKALIERLDDLEVRARTQGASAETLGAIQGARVLMKLAELPILPRDGLSVHATRG
jgi:hypothetical protein